ncbi:MAG: dehydrogenase [Bacteroidaceae bacterium]|nr:dehydrogenase [Bacteroidaceae bacterium]
MKSRSFLLILIVFALYSCGNKDNRSTEEADTLATEEPLALLPDTVLPSASAVSYVIDVVDTVTDANLSTIASNYDGKEGWFTFRGNTLRNADYGGTVKGTPTSIVKDWQFNTFFDASKTSMGTWGGGTGWTGQPLYLRKSGEIIVASLCGRVYFLNFGDGTESRPYIDVTNPIKGTCSLEPVEHNLLFVGQGIPKVAPMGQIAIDLREHKRVFFSGADRKAQRSWGAFDSSPVVVGGFLFWPGENGTIYKYKVQDNNITLHTALRYRCRGAAPGVENSICVYSNYGWFGDNNGNVICINLNTMRPVWHYNNHDDIDGSIVCEVVDGVPYIYTGCEVDKQGNSGICHFVKLNGLTGQLVWEQQIPCRKLNIGGKHFDGGLYCTPLLGKGDCEDLIFANICQRGNSSNAEFTAFSKKTGEIVYRTPLNAFAWSSPVAFYNEKNQAFIFTGDSSGNAYLIEGKTGKILFRENMVNNFESSPVVVDNHFVVGSRGSEIYRFSVK